MAWLLFFTHCDVFWDILQYTRMGKCNLFVLYNKNSNGLLKDFWGMKKEKQIYWRDLTWIWRHLCVSLLIARSRSTTNENAHRSHVIVIDDESELSNCFSINQLVGQNITYVFWHCFEFENRFLLLLVVYHQQTASSSANQKAGFVIVHWLVYI